MKLVSFFHAGKTSWGVLEGESLIDLGGQGLANDLMELAAGGRAALDAARAAAALPGARRLALGDARLLAPLARPGKIVGIGLNYLDHCREQNVPIPKAPMVFAKFASSVIGPHEPIHWDNTLTSQVDFEAELAVVIGRTARQVPAEEALEYVLGYTALNDVSARDLQFADRQWVRAKSLDSFCPLGPVLVTADEIPDPGRLSVQCRVNGSLMQDSSTSEMIFGVPELVAFLSRAFTLEPGDVIATGTPNGVGVFRDPKIFLQDGDIVEVEIEGVGILSNPVRIEN